MLTVFKNNDERLDLEGKVLAAAFKQSFELGDSAGAQLAHKGLCYILQVRLFGGQSAMPGLAAMPPLPETLSPVEATPDNNHNSDHLLAQADSTAQAAPASPETTERTESKTHTPIDSLQLDTGQWHILAENIEQKADERLLNPDWQTDAGHDSDDLPPKFEAIRNHIAAPTNESRVAEKSPGKHGTKYSISSTSAIPDPAHGPPEQEPIAQPGDATPETVVGADPTLQAAPPELPPASVGSGPSTYLDFESDEKPAPPVVSSPPEGTQPVPPLSAASSTPEGLRPVSRASAASSTPDGLPALTPTSAVSSTPDGLPPVPGAPLTPSQLIKTQTYYQILGVNRLSSFEEIHTRFLTLIHKLRRSRAKTETRSDLREFREVLRAICIAHDILKDPITRTDYDLRMMGMRAAEPIATPADPKPTFANRTSLMLGELLPGCRPHGCCGW